MKVKKSLGFATGLALLIWACDNAMEPEKEPDLSAEALEFSLKVIETYITNDTTTFKTFLPETIYLMEANEEPIPRSEISVTEVFATFDFSNYSMDDFNRSYSARIQRYDEFKDQTWVAELTFWRPDAKDYLFTATLVPGEEDFMLDDLRTFVVTKRSGQWKVRAFRS